MKQLKKDIRVEVLRILGILIVIGVHLCLPMSEGASLDRGRALITAFFADGVAIFWCISGFFIFDKYSYSCTMKRMLKTVVLPLIGFSIFIFFFGDLILKNNVSLIESISHSKEECINIIRSIMMWENPFTEHLQLWYLYIYILLMMVSPVVYAFIRYLNEDILRKKYFMVISFVILVFNDLSNNQFAGFSHHTWNALIPAMILMVWGNLIFSYVKERTIKKKTMGVALLLFIICNLLRWIIQIVRSQIGVEGIHIYFWFTSIALVNVCCLIVIVFYFTQSKVSDERFYKRVNWLSSNVFSIYLLHMFVYFFIQRFINFEEAYQFLCVLLPLGESFLSEVVYVLIIVSIVFIFTFLLAIGIKSIKKICVYLFCKHI